jgi:hypothetical protein
MSVRMALDIEEDTKPSNENRMIGTARMPVHIRRLVIVGFVRLRDALRLSAVTGLSSAASLVSAASKLAVTVSSAQLLPATLARKKAAIVI